LCKAYKKAMNHAEFLLSIELNSRVSFPLYLMSPVLSTSH
jgi:hypothetical protein